MKKKTDARYEQARNQRKNFDQKNCIETKVLNIGDGWSLRIEKRNMNADSLRLRT